MDQPPSNPAEALQTLQAALKDLEVAGVAYQVRRRMEIPRVTPPAAPMDMTRIPDNIVRLVIPTSRRRRLLAWARRIWRRIREARAFRR